MTSNYTNSSQRTREYSYKTQMLEDYNPLSANYESFNSWQDNNTLSPRLSDTRRLDNLSIHSSNQNDSATKSKDEFVIFGSFVRQRSEKRNSEMPNEKTKTLPHQSTTYKNLPVKGQREGGVEYTQIVKSENIAREQSRPNNSYRTDIQPDSLFDLIQNYDEVDILSNPAPRDLVDKNIQQEPIISLRKVADQSAPPGPISTERSDDKDNEIAHLKKTADRLNKKVSVLTDNNKKLQEHLKNLLDERKQILQHIDNSEFEEIIEEEEVKKAKPRDSKTRVEYVQENVKTLTEVSHTNCLQRGRVTLADIPQHMLESFKTDIVRHEKERTELEKRSLIEALRMQHEKQLHTLQAEYQTKQRALQQVSVQSYKKTQFHHKVSEVNLERTRSPKPDSRSIGVNALPTLICKQCQSEDTGARSPMIKFMAKTTLSPSQKSMVEKVLKHIENGNYDGLVGVFEEVLCPPRRSVGTNSSPDYLCKSTNTAPPAVETVKPIEVVKQRVSQESRGTLVKPILIQRGCQPEDTFKFETGTMTDQKFCRSQGMMTVADYTDYRSPTNVDSVVNRTSSRSESRKQKISQTTYISSPTTELVSIQERSVTPKVVQVTKKSPETEHIREIKITKTENTPNMKPVNIIEETKHTVGESTQHVTSVLDKNKIPKSDIPVTVECWETISRLKDGEVVEKTETYHDRLVSTDMQKIKEHLNQHDLHSEQSPTARFDAEYFKKESQTASTEVTEHPVIVSESFEVKNRTAGSSGNMINLRSNFEQQNESTGFKDIKVQQKVPTLPDKSTYSESEMTISSSIFKRPSEYKEVKIQQNMSTPLFNETSSRGSVFTTSSNTIKKVPEKSDNAFRLNMQNKPLESVEVKVKQNVSELPHLPKKPSVYKEIKVRSNLSMQPIKETSHSQFTSSSTKDPVECKVQQNLVDVPIKDASYSAYGHESTSDISFISDTMDSKEVKIQQTVPKQLWKTTSYTESENIVKKPAEYKEIKSQPIATKETMYREMEHRVTSGSPKNPPECREVKIRSNLFASPSSETSYYESEYSTTTTNMTSPPQVIENVRILPLNETSFVETENTYITTNTSSRMPGDDSSSKFMTQTSKPHSPTNSIGILTSPTSFKSYSSSSKARSNFSSNRREMSTFESELKAEEAKRKMNSRINVESSENTVPISFETKVSRIPVQSSNNTIRSSSTASSNSAFHSLPSNKEENKSVNIPVTVDHSKTDCSEILLSENIFQSCTELLLWMKNVDVITTSTIDQLPSSLVTVSTTLVDWWVDLTVTVDSDQLMAIVTYITSTFSKNLLKYLVVSMDQQGNTCLHYIIGHQLWDSFNVIDSINIVDPNIYNSQGYTVLMVACTIKVSSESALYNLRKLATGANVNLRSKVQGQTAVFIAALHDNSQAIEMLHEIGADLNICDNDGNTPLMITCSNSNVDAAMTLLSIANVALDPTNKNGKTAFEMAEEAQCEVLLEVFHQRKTMRASSMSGSSRVVRSSYRSSGSSRH